MEAEEEQHEEGGREEGEEDLNNINENPVNLSTASASDTSPRINSFNFLLTNARSLAPKIDSFVENFNERDIDLCVVTETWLAEDGGF